MTDGFSELTDDEILNPVENSYEAVILIATYFSMYEEEGATSSLVGDVTTTALLTVVPKKVREILEDLKLPVPSSGLASQEQVVRNARTRGRRYIDAVQKEISESADPSFVRQAFAANITDARLQRATFAMIVALANSSGKIDESEQALINELAGVWSDTVTGLGEEDGDEEGAWLNDTMRRYDLGNAFHKASVELAGHKAGKSGSSCFVATAVLEDGSHPALAPLRGFRDAHLARSKAGRVFIGWYYRAGPKMARKLQGKPLLKRMIKFLIIIPLSKALGAFDRG